MANMSYCRFQNTLLDMQDCFNHLVEAVDLNEPMDLSDEEQRAFQSMYDMLHDMKNMMEQATEIEAEEKVPGWNCDAEAEWTPENADYCDVGSRHHY
jgi:hypothetical protein